MPDPLLAFSQDFFQETLNDVPNHLHDQIIDILKNIRRVDILQNRYESLKGKLRLFRRFRVGNYRVFFIYCRECYEEYDRVFQCFNCNDNYEKIIAFCVFKRKNAYNKLERKFGSRF